MKQMFLAIMASVLCFSVLPEELQAQNQQKERTTAEVAAQEAERLETLLGLEGWQVFYVDSVLQYNYAHLQAELRDMQASGVENYSLYTAVRDRWQDRTDESFRKYLTPEQWEKYLKSGAGKAQKARAKRAQKARKD